MKSFNLIKQKPHFKYEVENFIKTLLTMGILKKHKRKLEEALSKFLLNVKEDVYRQVDYDYHREDVMNKIKEYYGCKGLRIAGIIPENSISEIIEMWQDNLCNADTSWEINWMVLEDVLYGEVWLSGLKHFKPKQITMYKNYLKEWFATHNEGDPVCIAEFFSNDAQDGEYKRSCAKKGGNNV